MSTSIEDIKKLLRQRRVFPQTPPFVGEDAPVLTRTPMPIQASQIPVTDTLPALRDPGFERFYAGLHPPTPQPVAASSVPVTDRLPPQAAQPPLAAPPQSPMVRPEVRTDELAPRLAPMPQGSFAGDAPPPESLRGAPPASPALSLPRMMDASDPSAMPPPDARTMAVPAGPLRNASIQPSYSTEGMNPLQRAITKLTALQSSEPNAQIDETSKGIDVVPMMSHMGRKQGALKGAGRGALQGLANGGPLGALFGALTGATVGALSPATIERLNHERQIARQQGDVQQQLGMEGEQAKLEAMKAGTDQTKANTAYIRDIKPQVALAGIASAKDRNELNRLRTQAQIEYQNDKLTFGEQVARQNYELKVRAADQKDQEFDLKKEDTASKIDTRKEQVRQGNERLTIAREHVKQGWKSLEYSGAGLALREQAQDDTNARDTLHTIERESSLIDKLSAQAEEADTNVQSLKSQVGSLSGDDKTKAQQSLNQWQARASSLKGEVDNRRKRLKDSGYVMESGEPSVGLPSGRAGTPTRMNRAGAPQGSGKYTGHVFINPESLQSAFPGRSPQEIRRIVESNGGKFKQ
jgi:hypothetical protein